MLALQSVSLRKNGEPKNPVLRAYYLEKCKTKAKMTALGAIIHKLCNIVFAVLWDEASFLRLCKASAFLYLLKTATLFTCFYNYLLTFLSWTINDGLSLVPCFLRLLFRFPYSRQVGQVN